MRLQLVLRKYDCVESEYNAKQMRNLLFIAGNRSDFLIRKSKVSRVGSRSYTSVSPCFCSMLLTTVSDHR